MLLLEKSGSMWIYDLDEFDELEEDDNYDKVIKHTLQEFCTILSDSKESHIPRKFTEREGGFKKPYWDANFSIQEIFEETCVDKTHPFEDCSVYLMPWGEVFIFHIGVDSGGYDAEKRIDRLPSLEAWIDKIALFKGRKNETIK